MDTAETKGAGMDVYGSFMSLPGVAARKRLNRIALCEACLVPWALFAATVLVLSSSLHYDHTALCNFMIFCGLMLTGLMAGRACLARQNGDEETWYAFIAVTSAIALILGLMVGLSNFESNVKPHYHLTSLSLVHGADPSSVAGRAYLDASSIVFTPGTHIDMSRSLSYKQGDVYCVAPITIGNTTLAKYDFWAVGLNCCRPFGGDFWCGGSTYDAEALAGLRLMNDYQEERYRLAVQQAQAEYGIKASSPIFLSWTHETTLNDDIAAYLTRSHRTLTIAVVLHLLFQICCVGCVLSRYSSPDTGAYMDDAKKFAML